MQLLPNKKVAQISINKLTSLSQQDYLNGNIFNIGTGSLFKNYMYKIDQVFTDNAFDDFPPFLLNQVRGNENYVDTNTFGFTE